MDPAVLRLALSLAVFLGMATALPQNASPYPYASCQMATVTSTYETCITKTITSMSSGTQIVCSTASPSCTATTTISGSVSTSTVTTTPSVSTVTDIIITPTPVTTTTTLSSPLSTASVLTLSLRGEGCQASTVTSISTVTLADYTSTVWTHSPPSSCPDVTAPLCTTTQAPVTSTVTATASASTTHVTNTLLPITVTATLNPTTSFNVLRATGITPVSSNPTDIAVASSNNMYANLVFLPQSSDGSYVITFNLSNPDTASQFTIDPTTQELLGTGNGANAFVANTAYSYYSDYIFFSNDPDPVGADYGYPPLTPCTVDANKVLTCQAGTSEPLENKFSICGTDINDTPGYNNINGNLFLTPSPENQDCAAATLYLEEVVLYQLIPAQAVPSLL